MNQNAASSGESAPVVMAGAGPVGLALALRLATAQVPSVILEKKAQLDPHSRATLIVPRTMAFLERLGVLEAFLAAGERSDAIRMLRASDRRNLLTFDFSELAARTSTPFALALSQDRTERLLLDAVEATGLVEIAWSTPLDGFDHHPRGVVVKAAGRSIEATLLVGADGAHSQVRTQLGWALEGKTYPTRAVLADVRVAASHDTREGWLVDPDADSFTLAIRFGDGVWRIIEAAVPDSVEDADLPDRARRITGRLFGHDAWQETLWTAAYRKHERRAARFVEGRIVLAGDAAHLNSPAGGQGMNAGMLDAEVLGGAIIAGLVQPAELAALLAAYEARQIATFDDDIRGFTRALEQMETVPAWVRRMAFSGAGLLRALGLEHMVAERLSMLNLDKPIGP